MVDRLTVHEAAALIREADTLLLDVREAHEVAHCAIDGAKHIPLREVPRRALEELDPGTRVVVYCHHGGRSLMAARLLVSLGFESVANLEGGIEAWSLEIDPSIPRY